MATVLTSTYMMDTTHTLHPALKDMNILNSDLPILPLDQPVPTNVLSRRRHAISSGGDSPYRSRPRMKRRGAISYDKADACALYIRYLGEALVQKDKTCDKLNWPEMLANETKLLSLERKRCHKTPISGEGYSSRSLKVQSAERTSVFGSIGVEQQPATTIQNVLTNIESWDFDIFAFSRVTEGRPLFHIGLHVFQKHKLFEHFNLDIMTVRKFLTSVESNYHEENAYHNSVHAADVTQATNCLLSDPMIYSSLSPVEIFASLLAAMCHDLDHPGVNQNYLINTSSHLATIHGTNSLLERHHCHTAKAILGESKLLNHLSDTERMEIVSLMEDFILSTDFSKHKHFMGQFEEMLVSEHCMDLSKQVERHFVLMMAIKAADISNPTRSLHLSKRWSEKIMEEFYLQGDAERRLNLPISFLCDRETVTIPKSQSDFFGFVALPLFKAWSQFVRSPLSVQMCRNITNNKNYWDDMMHSSSDSD